MFQDVAVKHKGVHASSQPIEGHERLSFVLDPQSLKAASRHRTLSNEELVDIVVQALDRDQGVVQD